MHSLEIAIDLSSTFVVFILLCHVSTREAEFLFQWFADVDITPIDDSTWQLFDCVCACVIHRVVVVDIVHPFPFSLVQLFETINFHVEISSFAIHSFAHACASTQEKEREGN